RVPAAIESAGAAVRLADQGGLIMDANQHHGTFSKWAKPEFLPNLIPIIPPGATLSANAKVDPAMLGKVPGEYRGDGQWCGFRGFTQHTATDADVATWG